MEGRKFSGLLELQETLGTAFTDNNFIGKTTNYYSLKLEYKF